MTAPIPFFDGHNDFLLRLMTEPRGREARWPGPSETGHLDLPRMRAAGFAGGLFAIFVPSGGERMPDDLELMSNPPYTIPLPPGVPLARAQHVALRMAGLLHWMARAAPEAFALCRSVAEIRAAMASGRVAAVMHMEGAEAIGPDLDALPLFHEMGLRSLGPVWSRPNAFGEGVPMSCPASPDSGAGLTGAGRDLVRLCGEMGVLIDLSHLNEKGFDEVARLSDAPLVASHSNAHAVTPSARNLTDRQLRVIRDSGGLVGLNFATCFLNPDGRADGSTGWGPVLRHLEHLLELLGEDHVALGSDFDGARVPAVIGDVTGVQALLAELAARGWGAALIAKLARENWLACLERTWR